MIDTRLMIQLEYDWTPETLTRAVAVWRRLVEARGSGLTDETGYRRPMESKDLTDEWLTALILSDGHGVKDGRGDAAWTPVRLSLVAYSDYGGNCLDAANVRALGDVAGDAGVETSTGGYHGDGEAWMQIGEVPVDHPTAEDAIVSWEHVADLIEGLDDYPLISDDAHSEYVDELAIEAWDQWLESDVRDTVKSALVTRMEIDEPFTVRLRELFEAEATDDAEDVSELAFEGRSEDIREAYYSFEDNEWECDGATSVNNGRHDEAVAHVILTVFSQRV